MGSASTTAPPTPPTFISTASPTSSPFLGIAAERRSRDGADPDSKFSRDGHPAGPRSALRPALKCALQKPEQASKEQEHNQPAHSTRQQGGGESRPFEPELTEDASTVQHPMPAGVSDQRGQDDRAHAFRDDEEEEELQRWDEQDEHEELAQFDSDIERQERGQQMRPRELQRFPQGKRETKSVNQAKTKGHHPAALQTGAAHYVFER